MKTECLPSKCGSMPVLDTVNLCVCDVIDDVNTFITESSQLTTFAINTNISNPVFICNLYLDWTTSNKRITLLYTIKYPLAKEYITFALFRAIQINVCSLISLHTFKNMYTETTSKSIVTNFQYLHGT